MDDFNTVFRRRLINTLSALIEFLDSNHLTWWAAYGTAIGAVRHKGMIPWDDDVDICMPRKDYDRLIDLRSSLVKTNYEILLQGDNGYILDFAKFCDKTTTICETPGSLFGVYIDIFPLDDCPLSFEDFSKQVLRINRIQADYLCLVSRINLRYVWQLLITFRIRSLQSIIHRYFRRKQLDAAKVLEEYQSLKWPIVDSGYYVQTTIGCYGIKERFPKEWFEDYKIVDFEGIQIRIPSGCHEYLSHLYGDYMKFPPKYVQKTHHSQYYVNLNERLDFDEVKTRIKKGEKVVY